MSSFEYGANVTRAHGLIGESKRAVLAHLPSGTKKGAERDATESAADADPPDANRGQLGETQANALQSHHDIHRAIHRTDHCGNVVLAGEARRIEDIGARGRPCR